MRLPNNKLESVDKLEKTYYSFIDLPGFEQIAEETLEDLENRRSIDNIRFELGLDTNLPKIIAKQYRRI